MPAADVPPGELDPIVASWSAPGGPTTLSPKTIRTYADSAMQLLTFLRERDDKHADPLTVARTDVQDFLGYLAPAGSRPLLPARRHPGAC